MTRPAGGRPVAPGLALADLLTVSDQTDAGGRLLLEDSAPERARRRAASAGVAMETVECRYPDSPSRQGGRMNASAYEALRQDTAEILDGFAWLTTRYLALHPTRRRTVQALFDTSQLGITLPLVLFRRSEAPVPAHKALATWVASIFKASRGVFSAAVDLRNTAGPPFRKLTGAEVMAFAEERGHFRRAETGRVCAAPTRLIERAVTVLVTGEGGDAGRSGLEHMVDFGLLWEVTRRQDELGDVLSALRARIEHAAARVGVADPAALFATPVPDGGRMRPLGEVATEAAARATAVQAELNRLLGRRAGATVTVPAVLAML
ncbi:MAG: hypothetical protein ABR511_11275 [Acidimicrobiales bacterium]